MSFMRQLDIIIPVYRGLDETKECILSLLPSMPEWARLIVINDCSPEPKLTAWLKDNSVKLNFDLYENIDNKGFVGTVNFGMALNAERDILLLNSDVEVANSDWLNRMRTAAYRHAKVASLTPFSNNATICSFPHFCEDNDLYAGLSVDELDQLFSDLPLTDTLVEVPTGVGFCMYIRRDCLNAIGLFDEETFGKGYGEENDWCQRALKSGWKNYHQLNVFAYHKGGVSFQDEGDPRKSRALELLNGLHQNYTQDVMQFIAQDPAKPARLMAKIRHLAELTCPLVLSITHHLGGGVAQHVTELSTYYRDKAWFLRLTPGVKEGTVNLYLSAYADDKNDAYVFNVDTENEKLIQFLREIGVAHIHFHHTIGLHPKIWQLPSSLGLAYDVTLHDYYMINGNPTLTDKLGRFVGDTTSSLDELDSLCRPADLPVTGLQWQQGVFPLLVNANRVIYPSYDLFKRFNQLYTLDAGLKQKSIVSYHPDAFDYPSPESHHLPNTQLKVLVLGAISREKGADLLEKVALLADRKEIEFHLLGYGYRPLRGVINHGAYNQQQLTEKLENIGAHVIWYPAQCPETYSYTLSTALEHGYPVVASNLGAFIERIQNREHSFLLDWNTSPQDALAFWQNYAAHADLTNLISKNESNKYNHFQNFYCQHYLNFDKIALTETSISLSRKWSKQLSTALSSLELSRREKLLQWLWLARNYKMIGAITRIIPFSVQRAVKRVLSRKPMHEIIK